MDICNSPEQKVVLGLLSKSLFNTSFTVNNNVNWDDVYKESLSQAVLPIVFSDKNVLASLPDEFRKKVDSAVMRYARIAMNNRRSHAYLHKLLTAESIDYCILKGVVSAQYYPQPFLRTMGDVDFYVNPSDLDRVGRILADNGFTEEPENAKEEGHHHTVYKKQGAVLEMHYEISGLPHSELRHTVSNMFSDIYSKATITNSEFVTFMAPSDFHHGLIMLLHLQNHMIAEGIGLRHLCDWAVFVNTFKGYDFERLFSQRLKSIGLWNFCKMITHACVLYLCMPEPEWLNNVDTESTRFFINEVLSGGNFGRKREGRRYEGMMISVSGREGQKQGLFIKIISTINRNARVHWPILKKLPILYPIAWIYCFIRLGVLILVGKRPKLHISDSIKSSNQRKDFYESLKLFEPEE